MNTQVFEYGISAYLNMEFQNFDMWNLSTFNKEFQHI